MNIDNLYQAAKDGNQSAEEQLFELLTARFRLFVQRKIWDRHDGEELTQDALMTVFNKYKEIDHIDNIAAWAHKVLNNKILNYFKTKALYEKKLDAARENLERNKAEIQANPDNPLERQLLNCLKKISSANLRHARILNLHYQGFTVREICEKLSLTQSNLYSVLCRARSMLERCLEKGDI